MVPLGIDKEKLFLQISRIDDNLIKLREIQKNTEINKEDSIHLSAAERILQIIIEECINIGSHVISGFMFRRPDTYREIFRILKEENIISKVVADNMESFVAFRNKLVHLYWKIEREEIYSKFKDINTIKVFVEEITANLKNKNLL